MLDYFGRKGKEGGNRFGLNRIKIQQKEGVSVYV